MHADIKPENVLRAAAAGRECAECASSSSRRVAGDVRLVDLGNAVPVGALSAYYGDFEIQSLQYRAPEVRTAAVCYAPAACP